MADKFFDNYAYLKAAELYKEAVDVIQMSRDLVRATEKGVEEIWGQEQVLWSNKYSFTELSNLFI